MDEPELTTEEILDGPVSTATAVSWHQEQAEHWFRQARALGRLADEARLRGQRHFDESRRLQEESHR